MKYWEEYQSKWGFGDGDAVPPDAWALRYVYVREIGAGESPAPTGAGSTLPAGSSAQAANQTEAHPPHSSDAQRRTNNRIAKGLGSAIRLFAHDRSGLHNPYLIGRAAAKAVDKVPEKSLCKGLYRGGWDPGENWTEPDADTAMDAAVAAAGEMELEDLVSVKVTIAGRLRSSRTARRRAA